MIVGSSPVFQVRSLDSFEYWVQYRPTLEQLLFVMQLALLLAMVSHFLRGTPGPFLADLSDYAAHQQSHVRQPAETNEANLARLVRALQRNSCTLEDTCTDGNCGLDAIIGNLKRLEMTEPALAHNVQMVFKKKGLESACQALRLGLLVWIRDNEHLEILPEVRLLDWIAMEGYRSKHDYISAMRKDGEWIDTLMLYAASAVLRVQIVVFLEDGSAHVLAAPEVQQMESSSILLLANVGNRHFYGVRPLPTEVEFVDPSERVQQDLLHRVCPPEDESGSGSEVEEGEGEQLPSRQELLFRLAGVLIQWNPWDASSAGELPNLCDEFEASGPGDVMARTLSCRSALKLLQHEAADAEAGIDRSFALRIAKNHLARWHGCCAFSKSRTLSAKLCLAGIQRSIARPCAQHSKQHTCLDIVRQAPKIVLKWRKLFYALPKADREERLRDMFMESKRAHDSEDPDFRTAYSVLGMKVCRNAFISITGVHADTLQRVRGSVVQGAVYSCNMAAWRSRRAPAYLDCRSWLIEYARQHADTSPLNDQLWLPYARKQFFWAAYLRDCSLAHVA